MKMWISTYTLLLLCTIITHKINGIEFVDLPAFGSDDGEQKNDDESDYFPFQQKEPTTPEATTTKPQDGRRYWLVSQHQGIALGTSAPKPEDRKDISLKNKIATLVDQTLQDTEIRIKSISHLKQRNSVLRPYKIGFILSLVKKSKEVLSELFNVAVKHRDEWKALEQLKVFELITHTNVDTTNLVRQLVEIHLQYFNKSSTNTDLDAEKRRIVLL